MVKNILLTGRPGCGKTTLIREIIEEGKLDAGGFYTSEIRKSGRRVGFEIITLDGKRGILAHVNIKSPYRVSKYRVNILDLEDIAVKSIIEAVRKSEIVVIDEIGKMELYSQEFKNAVIKALDSPNKVLGTIKISGNGFTDKIRDRIDTVVLKLTKDNKIEIKKKIRKLIFNNIFSHDNI